MAIATVAEGIDSKVKADLIEHQSCRGIPTLIGELMCYPKFRTDFFAHKELTNQLWADLVELYHLTDQQKSIVQAFLTQHRLVSEELDHADNVLFEVVYDGKPRDSCHWPCGG